LLGALSYISAADDGKDDATAATEVITPVEVKALDGNAGQNEENDEEGAAAAATSQVEMSSLLHDVKT
jgi:hypothetical protein